MQKFCKYLQETQSEHWNRTDALRKENELLRLKLYLALHHIQNNGLPLPETLTGIINPPAHVQIPPGPWWKRVLRFSEKST